MAYTFSVNNSPITSAVAMYTIVSTLMSAGWTKVMDSDGTTYSASGVRVTSGSAGTGGLGNTNAWIRLQAPAVNGGAVVNQTREITIQRGTTNLLWRIKYSASALFTGGSPAATVTPSAADEVFMTGAGTDAAPTFLSWFNADNNYRWHIAAGGAAEFYSFVAWGQNLGTFTASGAAICLDVMATGSFPTMDVDPAVMYCSSATSISEILSISFPVTNLASSDVASARARAWLGATSSAGASITSNNVNVGICRIGTSVGALTTGSNAWTSKQNLLPCLWGNQNTTLPRGVKGISTLFMLGTVLYANGTTTCSSIGTRDKIYFGNLWLPWSGATPLI